MRSREEFGKYLLLKKLSEDPLGETFRAGRVASGSVEQVVLLRVFNGRNVDGSALAQALSGRESVHAALKNPNIGNGVDLGEERGVPFVAYDYISGRNLESLLIQASNTNSPLPVDHALLIAERMSLALAAAAETRVGETRAHHGFAVPHLVMVSNEGETRVLGFEAAPGLARQAGSFEGQITRYLAPEVVAGQGVERSDDVFTLGAILYELLACKPLPQAGASGYGPVIDGAQVAYDAAPIPAPVAALLKKSLVPRGQRISDAATWHKNLSQVMADAGWAATTFNLAFFMHNLFRQEIEQENREMEEEKGMEVAAPAAAAATAAEAEAPPPATDADATASGGYEEAKSGGGKGLWIAVAAVLLIAALAAGWWFVLRPQQEAARAAAQPPPTPVEEAPAEPAGPTPEELQAQIAEMLETRSQQMEDKLGQQYDEQIQALQAQLEDAKDAAERAAAERERQRLEEERRQQEEADRLAAEAAAEEERLRQEEAKRLEEERKLAEAQKAAEAEKAEQQQAQAKPPEPAVKEGDLIAPGTPGVVPPQLLSDPDVRYPPMARKLSKQADVEVRVLVDERGNVRDAQLAGKKAGFGLDQAALEAARGARFRPATKDNVKVKMYYNLIIKFRL